MLNVRDVLRDCPTARELVKLRDKKTSDKEQLENCKLDCSMCEDYLECPIRKQYI